MTSTIRSAWNVPRGVALPLALVASVGASLIVEVVIAAVAHAAGASADFRPLTLAGLLGPTIVALMIALMVWELVRQRAADAAAVMRWLVPVGLVVSWLPDVALGTTHRIATGPVPDTTWGEVVVLMVMHVFAAAIAVGLFSRLLPLRHRSVEPPNVAEPRLVAAP
jgi:hypothetical protein